MRISDSVACAFSPELFPLNFGGSRANPCAIAFPLHSKASEFYRGVCCWEESRTLRAMPCKRMCSPRPVRSGCLKQNIILNNYTSSCSLYLSIPTWTDIQLTIYWRYNYDWGPDSTVNIHQSQLTMRFATEGLGVSKPQLRHWRSGGGITPIRLYRSHEKIETNGSQWKQRWKCADVPLGRESLWLVILDNLTKDVLRW